MRRFEHAVLTSPHPLPVPVLTFPGGRLIEATVRDLVHDPIRQSRAQLALRDRFGLPVLLSAMDLSTEAEEFGATILFSQEEVPTVTGRLITDLQTVAALPVPSVGGKRTMVYLKTIEHLARQKGDSPLLGGIIGPFSLAGRLFGVSEALLATAMEPEMITALVEKVTGFLTEYARKFREAGADGILMAEPTAGLMSPSSAAEFSSPYVKRIREAVESDDFCLILHNCGARIAHLDATLASGTTAVHFGKPMDLANTLARTPPSILVGGNLDPAEVFVGGTPADVAAKTESLLATAAGHANFFISSGCDIPYSVPMENLAAFFDTVARRG